MTRVLITGASGFVGRQIMKALSEFDLELVPVIRKGNEKEIAAIQKVDYVITSLDIFAENEEWWIERCRGIDLVIHAAWYTEPGKYLWSSKNLDCLIGSIKLAKSAAVAGVKRFVGIGTCFEYDLSNSILSTKTALKPLTPYASAKAALYLTLLQWLPSQSIEFLWCRLFYLYGDGEDERRLVPYIRKQLERGEPAKLSSGRQIRDYLDVTEAGCEIAKVALGKEQGAINICSGIPVSVKEMAEFIADQYDRRDLLDFNAIEEGPFDPFCVLGVKNTSADH